MNKINNIKIHGNMNRRFAAVILAGVVLTATFSGCKAQKTEDISVFSNGASINMEEESLKILKVFEPYFEACKKYDLENTVENRESIVFNGKEGARMLFKCLEYKLNAKEVHIGVVRSADGREITLRVDDKLYEPRLLTNEGRLNSNDITKAIRYLCLVQEYNGSGENWKEDDIADFRGKVDELYLSMCNILGKDYIVTEKSIKEVDLEKQNVR